MTPHAPFFVGGSAGRGKSRRFPSGGLPPLARSQRCLAGRQTTIDVDAIN
jgi:hypothetical protein